jgi:hypothetical protein
VADSFSQQLSDRSDSDVEESEVVLEPAEVVVHSSDCVFKSVTTNPQLSGGVACDYKEVSYEGQANPVTTIKEGSADYQLAFGPGLALIFPQQLCGIRAFLLVMRAAAVAALVENRNVILCFEAAVSKASSWSELVRKAIAVMLDGGEIWSDDSFTGHSRIRSAILNGLKEAVEDAVSSESYHSSSEIECVEKSPPRVSLPKAPPPWLSSSSFGRGFCLHL